MGILRYHDPGTHGWNFDFNASHVLPENETTPLAKVVVPQYAPKQRQSSSGHRGIYWLQKHRKWVANTIADKPHVRPKFIGHFATLQEAVIAQRHACAEIFANDPTSPENFPGEEWRPLPVLCYEVSNRGRVRHLGGDRSIVLPHMHGRAWYVSLRHNGVKFNRSLRSLVQQLFYDDMLTDGVVTMPAVRRPTRANRSDGPTPSS
jgi:hypothetical protein